MGFGEGSWGPIVPSPFRPDRENCGMLIMADSREIGLAAARELRV